MTVHQDKVDLGMRYPKSLDEVLHRAARGENGVRTLPRQAGEQKIVKLGVEAYRDSSHSSLPRRRRSDSAASGRAGCG